MLSSVSIPCAEAQPIICQRLYVGDASGFVKVDPSSTEPARLGALLTRLLEFTISLPIIAVCPHSASRGVSWFGMAFVSNRTEYGDLLRVVGRVLDMEAAEQIEIIQHPTCITLSWCNGKGPTLHRSYRDIGLTYLRRQARTLRGNGEREPAREREELLRTLGQELDSRQLVVSGIVETARGYRVSGVADRRYVNELYTWSELRDASARQRAQRATALLLAGTGSSRGSWAFWRRWSRGIQRPERVVDSKRGSPGPLSLNGRR